MKKILFLMLALVGMGCAFSSCSSDDDDNNGKSNPVVGTWVSTDYNVNDTITFDKDGFLVQHVGSAEGSWREIYSGTYSAAPDMLFVHYTSGKRWSSDTKKWTLIEDAEEESKVKISIKGNVLKMLGIVDDPNSKPANYKRL